EFTTLTLAGGATTIWELNSVTSPLAGTNYDTIVLDLTAVVNVNGTLNISLIGGVSTLDTYWNTGHTFTLFSGGGTVGGYFSGLTGDYTFTTQNGGTRLFSYAGGGSTDLLYTYSAVPEPQTSALAALGVSAVL